GRAFTARVDVHDLVVGDLQIARSLVHLVDELRALLGRNRRRSGRESLPAHAIVEDPDRLGEVVLGADLRGAAAEQQNRNQESSHGDPWVHDGGSAGARVRRIALIASRSRLPSSRVTISTQRNAAAIAAPATRVISLPPDATPDSARPTARAPAVAIAIRM